MAEKPNKARILELAPSGHYLAIRIGFAFPVFEDNHLPQDWIDVYTSDGLMLRDPIVTWMYQNTGTIRWSDLPVGDSNEVLAMARQHGLVYGVVACCMDPATGERSYGSFARPDREFERDEIKLFDTYVQTQHRARKRPNNLTDAEAEALRMVRDGRRFKEIAFTLGISESAVKARLTNAKRKLNAKTSVQAVSIASAFGML